MGQIRLTCCKWSFCSSLRIRWPCSRIRRWRQTLESWAQGWWLELGIEPWFIPPAIVLRFNHLKSYMGWWPPTSHNAHMGRWGEASYWRFSWSLPLLRRDPLPSWCPHIAFTSTYLQVPFPGWLRSFFERFLRDTNRQGSYPRRLWVHPSTMGCHTHLIRTHEARFR